MKLQKKILISCISMTFALSACGSYEYNYNDDTIIDNSEQKTPANTQDPEDVVTIKKEDIKAIEEYTPIDYSTVPITPATDFEYVIDDDFVSIISYTGSSTMVRIPDSIEGRKRLGIAKNTFSGNEDLTFIMLPSTMEYIPDASFRNCDSLQEAVICFTPTISSELFASCDSLRRVYIGEGTTVIDEKAFSHCEKLTQVVIPSTIKEVKSHAFEYCIRLESLDFSNTALENVESGAFKECASLTNKVYPASFKK